MTHWIIKTDEFGQIDLSWGSTLYDTEKEAYKAMVEFRKSAKHDEFFRLFQSPGEGV